MTKHPTNDAELMSRLLTTQPTPAECLVAAARIEQLADALAKLEKERDEIVLINNRQAVCMHFTAAELGPDYVATIEGLPKAAKHAVATLRDRLSALTAADRAQVEVIEKQADTIIRINARAEAAEAAEAEVATLRARLVRMEGALRKADEELKAGGYRPTQWPRTAIAAALTDGGSNG